MIERNTVLLSILIPAYDWDCTRLVRDLIREVLQLPCDIEVIVMDDGSPTPVVHSDLLVAHETVPLFVERLATNVGRAQVRNLLATRAQGQYLLFLDCDSEVPNGFVEKYVSMLSEDDVLVGGRRYLASSFSPLCSLHWEYGIRRESKSVAFQSNNFVISSRMFREVRFDSSIKEYGHEDTLFGCQLQKRGAAIRHVDNPVVHLDIQENTKFVLKQMEAASTLGDLYFRRGLRMSTRLEQIGSKIVNLGLCRGFLFLGKWIMPSLVHNLGKDGARQLWMVDIVKLYRFLERKI